MMVLNVNVIRIEHEYDVLPYRNKVKEYAVKIGMGLVNQTKLITAASELVRNMLKYAHGGIATVEIVAKGGNTGLKLTFEDKGPGIPDIDLALKDGYSTGKSLGLGLPGARRLVNEFVINSVVDKGTTISCIKWKNG